MAIKKVVLTDNQTGDNIYPRTSYDNLDNIPNDLLRTDYLNVGDSNTQLPILGQNVNSINSWSSRTINLNGFKLFFFTGYFNVKKDMFLADWHTDNRVLFFLSKEIADYTDLQVMNAYIKEQSEKNPMIFRTYADNDSVSFEDFSQPTDPKSLPDSFNIYINGMINSPI